MRSGIHFQGYTLKLSAYVTILIASIIIYMQLFVSILKKRSRIKREEKGEK